MKMKFSFFEKYPFLIPLALSLYLFLVGYFATKPLPVTYDPAMHSEIVTILSNQIYPATWFPFSNTEFTYPPLFHWISLFFSKFGFPAHEVVIFLGVVFYSIFPILFYKIGLLWSKRTAIFSSFIGATISSWIEVFMAGEYPQLLATDLTLISFYYLLKHDGLKAGFFLGLVALSHPFVIVFALSSMILFFAFEFARNRNKKILNNLIKIAFVFFLVSLVWTPKYAIIMNNALASKWDNVKYYYQPGFVGWESVRSNFFEPSPATRVGLLFFLPSLIGFWVFAKRREFFFPIIFLFTIFFTFFHIPGTQYKFPDMLAISIPLCAAHGMDFFANKYKKTRLPAIFLIVLLVLFLPNPFIKNFEIKECCTQRDVPNQDVIEAAKWLKEYDYNYSRIIATNDYEVWFSVISRKYALDPKVSALEALSGETRQQSSDRAEIINGMASGKDVSELLKKHGIKYVVHESLIPFPIIYDRKGIKIYENK